MIKDIQKIAIGKEKQENFEGTHGWGRLNQRKKLPRREIEMRIVQRKKLINLMNLIRGPAQPP